MSETGDAVFCVRAVRRKQQPLETYIHGTNTLQMVSVHLKERNSKFSGRVTFDGQVVRSVVDPGEWYVNVEVNRPLMEGCVHRFGLHVDPGSVPVEKVVVCSNTHDIEITEEAADAPPSGLFVTDQSGSEIRLVEYGVVYRPFASSTLGNAYREGIITTRGEARQTVAWDQLETLEAASGQGTFTLKGGRRVGPVALQAGSLVGTDEQGFTVTLAMEKIAEIRRKPRDPRELRRAPNPPNSRPATVVTALGRTVLSDGLRLAFPWGDGDSVWRIRLPGGTVTDIAFQDICTVTVVGPAQDGPRAPTVEVRVETASRKTYQGQLYNGSTAIFVLPQNLSVTDLDGAFPADRPYGDSYAPKTRDRNGTTEVAVLIRELRSMTFSDSKPAAAAGPFPVELRGVIENLQSGDPAKRFAAASELLKMAHPASVPDLIGRLSDNVAVGNSSVAYQAMLALVAVGRPAVGPLIDTLNDRRYRPRVAQALGSIGDPAAVPPMVAMLGKEDVGGIPDALRAIRDPAATTHLLAAARDPNARTRQYAAYALYDRRQPSVLEALIGLLKDEDAKVRAEAASSLKTAKEKSAVGPLAAALGDPDAEVRKQAVWSLGLLGFGEAVEAVCRCCGDTYADVRQAAAGALGEIGDPRGAAALRGLLSDNHQGVRRTAEAALKKMGQDPAPDR